MSWATVKIGDIADVKGGKRLPKGMRVQDERTNYPYIRVTDFGLSGVDIKKIKFITQAAHEKTARYVISDEDVYISIAGTIGLVGIVPSVLNGANLTENAAKICNINDDFNCYFLMYFLRSQIGQGLIGAQIVGTSQPKLALFRLKDIDVPAPKREIQDWIVTQLITYDNLIENNNRRIAILEDMAQSLYCEWFVKFRFPDYQDCKFEESSLGLIPEGWDIVPLEEICERVTDGAHKSPQSINDGVPMASVKDMHDFGFNISTCRHISEEDYLELVRQDSVVKQDDILVAKDGSYLKHTFVVEKDLKVALLSSIAMLRPNEKVKTHWLAYTLKSNIVKERMKQCVSGVAIPRIILKDFRKFKIIFPPIELQEQWNEVAQGMIEQCWNLISRNNNLKKQRDMLLPKLMSGNIALK